MSSESQPATFDLTRSQLGQQSGPSTIQVIDERMSALFAVELSQLLQVPVKLEVEDTGASKFEDYLTTLETPGCYCNLEVEALGGQAFVGFERALVYSLLDRLFGGTGMVGGAAADGEHRRRFSLIEERIIRKLARLFGRSLEEAWRPVVPLKTRHSRIETEPGKLMIAQRQDWVRHTTFLMDLGATKGRVQFALPASLLGVHLKRLNMGAFDENSSKGTAWQDPLSQLLQQVCVEVIAELGKTSRPLKEIIELRVGDIIRLDQPADQPITVSVQQIPKFRGEITVHHGNLAVTLTSLHHQSSALTKETSS